MTRRTNLFVVMITTAVALLATATDAEAQRRGRGRKIDGVRFDVHLDAGWHQSFGVGFRVDIPIVPDGFIDGVDDELALSPGLEFFFWAWHGHRDNSGYWDYRHDGVAFWPLIMAQWNFYLNEDWSIFPELGMGVGFWSYDHRHGRDPDYHSHAVARPFPSVSFGARWHFSDRNALLFRINWPAGAQIGITF